LDHVYTSIIGLIDSVIEGSATVSDNCPAIVTLNQRANNNTRKKIWSRDWSIYRKEGLLLGLREINCEIKCLRVSDFNDELEQKIMSVVDSYHLNKKL